MTDVLRPVVNVFSSVDDLEAATAWYTARLGAAPAVVAEQLVMFKVGAGQLTLHRIDEFVRVARAARSPIGRSTTSTRWPSTGPRTARSRTIFTGERLCQVLDPFGNLVRLRQAAG